MTDTMFKNLKISRLIIFRIGSVKYKKHEDVDRLVIVHICSGVKLPRKYALYMQF